MNTTKPLDSERGQPQRHEFIGRYGLGNKFCAFPVGLYQCGQPREAEVHMKQPEPPHRSEVAPEREFDHFSIVPFRAICGINRIGQSTSQTPERVKCQLCWTYWKEWYASYQLTRDDIAHASAEDEIQSIKEQSVNTNEPPVLDSAFEHLPISMTGEADSIRIERLESEVRHQCDLTLKVMDERDAALRSNASAETSLEFEQWFKGYKETMFLTHIFPDAQSQARVLMKDAFLASRAAAVEVITAKRDEWQTQGWTTHVFAANELLKLLGKQEKHG